MKVSSLLFFLLINKILNAGTPHAYGINQGDGTVTVIDINHDTIQTISGFYHNLRTGVVTPNGLYVYVGDDDGNLRIIDTSTNSVLPTIIVVDSASSLATSIDGAYVYVASHDNKIRVVSTVTNTVVATVGGVHTPQDIVVTADNLYAYITNASNNTVSVMRISDNTIIDNIVGFNHPLGISASPDGAYIYVTNIGNGTLSVIRLSDNTIIHVIEGFGSPRYGAPTIDGAFLYVSDLTLNQVRVIQTSDYSTVATIPVVRPSSVAISPDGQYVYVSSNQTSIYKYHIPDNTHLLTIPNLASPSNIAMGLTDPPIGIISGFRAKDRMLLQTNYYNRISWRGTFGNPIAYKIFRDAALTDLAGQVNGNVLEFIDHNRRKNQTYSYYIQAFYEGGYSSPVGQIEVH